MTCPGTLEGTLTYIYLFYITSAEIVRTQFQGSDASSTPFLGSIALSEPEYERVLFDS